MTEVVVSPPPVFDFEKALLAKEETGKRVILTILTSERLETYGYITPQLKDGQLFWEN